MKELNYHFYEITHCNMCGAINRDHKILGQRLNCSQGRSPKKKTGISTSVMQCTSCDLIYSNPQPVPYDIQDHYGIPPESYWIPEYFKTDPSYFADQIARAKKFLPFQPGMKVLDIGAGIGKCMIALENAGFDAYGFEASEPFYQRAIEVMKIKPEKLKIDMIEKVEYEPGSFDFIIFSGILEHVYDADAAIARAMKWLKPNGIVHIEVPSSKWLIGKVFNLYYKLRGTNYVTNLSPMHSPFHMYEFGLRSFEKNKEKHQYEIIEYVYFPCMILGIPKLFHPLLNWYMEKTKRGMQLEIWLRKK